MRADDQAQKLKLLPKTYIASIHFIPRHYFMAVIFLDIFFNTAQIDSRQKTTLNSHSHSRYTVLQKKIKNSVPEI